MAGIPSVKCYRIKHSTLGHILGHIHCAIGRRHALVFAAERWGYTTYTAAVARKVVGARESHWPACTYAPKGDS